MDLFTLQSLIFFLFSIFLINFIYNQLTRKKPITSGLKSYPLVGSLPEFIKNRHRFLDWSTEILGQNPTNTFFFRRLGNVQGITTANPLHVEHILKTNFENYPKGERFISVLEDFLGGGIFNSDGELWKVQRKTASFEFNTKSLRNFVIDSVRHEIEGRLVPFLKKAKENEEIVDLQDVLERFAFDNVCKVAFNEDPACLVDDESGGKPSTDFVRAFVEASNLSAGRFLYSIPFLWKIKKFLNIGSERQLRESISIVHDFAMKIIRSRKQGNPSSKDDLLSRFIADDDNSDEFLRDIVISFILAGRDTTSSSLAWFFWLLSTKPDVERNILKEIKTVRSRNQSFGEIFSFEELREMNYLHASISEALRLYPPVAIDTRTCREDDVMPDGTFVGKGWIVNYNAYAMGRMEGIWGKDCRDFKPERWLDNGIYRPENPYRFPVFHAGPRMCLGKEMAYIQMKSIAASVIENFEMNVLEKDTSPEKLLSLTMRMRAGLPIRVRKRCLHLVD